MLLFTVTILFILFVCIRLSVTTHYFKYYVGDQVVPWLTGFFNFFNSNLINPINNLFGKAPKTLIDITHPYGFEVLASIFNTLGQALSLIGVLMVPWFAKLVGRKSAVIILFFAAIFFTSSFYFFKPEQVSLILIFQIFGSITGGPISALLWVLYADTADYSEWKTGRRATGLVFSASIMSNKIGWAFGSMLAAFILDKTGFIPNMVQNADVLTGLKSMMSIIPAILGVLAIIVLSFFYKLDEPTMAKVKEDLELKRNEQKA
jgi:GPH family glycoside/pentoside/hexuronide:cation symporter